jgi:phosphopantothenate synthetase
VSYAAQRTARSTMSKAASEVIIVDGNQAIRVRRKVWDLYKQCAGQMIADGAIYEYYKGNARKDVLDAVFALHRKL